MSNRIKNKSISGTTQREQALIRRVRIALLHWAEGGISIYTLAAWYNISAKRVCKHKGTWAIRVAGKYYYG